MLLTVRDVNRNVVGYKVFANPIKISFKEYAVGSCVMTVMEMNTGSVVSRIVMKQ